jgi:hypothetical protein
MLAAIVKREDRNGAQDELMNFRGSLGGRKDNTN